MDKIEVLIDGQPYLVEIKSTGRQSELVVNGKTLLLNLPNWQKDPEAWHWFEAGGQSFEMDMDPDLHWIKSGDGLHRIEINIHDSAVPRVLSTDGRVKAPIPGLVSRVFVEEGQTVEAGERLLTLEAMKMENEMCAPKGGVVRNLNVSAGESVSTGEVMLTVE